MKHFFGLYRGVAIPLGVIILLQVVRQYFNVEMQANSAELLSGKEGDFLLLLLGSLMPKIMEILWGGLVSVCEWGLFHFQATHTIELRFINSVLGLSGGQIANLNGASLTDALAGRDAARNLLRSLAYNIPPGVLAAIVAGWIFWSMGIGEVYFLGLGIHILVAAALQTRHHKTHPIVLEALGHTREYIGEILTHPLVFKHFAVEAKAVDIFLTKANDYLAIARPFYIRGDILRV